MTAAAGYNSNSPLKAWVRALEMTAPIARDASLTFPDIIESLGDKLGNALAILSERESLTYSALAERCNRYARWALQQPLAHGDVVCLVMSNCPDYIAIWVGITRVGGVVALVNPNLAGDSLVHCISSVAPKHVIVGNDHVHAVTAILPRLVPSVHCCVHGPSNSDLLRIDCEVAAISGAALQHSEFHPPSTKDRALYIYTSGTTGLPKAANVSHFRLMQWTHWFAGMLNIEPSDRMYNCLPMYHSIGGVVATGASLIGGGSVLLRSKFSPSRFWDDVVDWNCTLFQYIGELCRYLVASPPHPRETKHQLRLCCGNGLKPDVWNEFVSRFQIPRVFEFYAATEGNFSLYNCEGEPGAIGRIPSFLAHRFPVALIKFDIEMGEPIRNDEGFCVRCASNEVGEAIGAILDDATGAVGRFEGYTDKAATDRKIIRDVFAKGDAWFRTGDLMRRDPRGFFYFVDRIGDTFRWKGENVSTTEVEEAITACSGVLEAVVYGVAIAGTDGRAGMAGIVVERDFDLAVFRQDLTKRLPEYACPLFIRIRQEIELTATFKPNKQQLLRESFDPATTADAIYFNDRIRETFVQLDATLYQRIQTGTVRL